MKTCAIIQAHMGSSRLPGKVLMDLEGQTVLERVLRRVQRCTNIDDVIVATSTLAVDDAIMEACNRMSVPISRGSDTDVLDRFLSAAHASSADVCVRITSDCPLVDPGVSDMIIEKFLEARPPVDYASNKIPQSYPRGLDTEVFSFQALVRAWEDARQQYERTHVTVYMYENPQQFHLLSITSDVDRADWRWTLDTPEDLSFIREVYRRLSGRPEFTWLDIVHLLEREPALRLMNQHIVQKAVREG